MIPHALWALVTVLRIARRIGMGIQIEPTVYNLEFKDVPQLVQVKVKVSCCSIGEMNTMLRAKVGTTGEETADANDYVSELFLDHLISWNIDGPDGQPLPHTMEGLHTLEPGVVTQIVVAWQVAMIQVPTNLSTPSPNGAISVEESLGLGNTLGSPGS
jgi:hypothetical protein